MSPLVTSNFFWNNYWSEVSTENDGPSARVEDAHLENDTFSTLNFLVRQLQRHISCLMLPVIHTRSLQSHDCLQTCNNNNTFQI